MKLLWIVLSAVITLGLSAAAVFAMPVAFTDRIAPGVRLGDYEVSGISKEDLAGVLGRYEEQIRQKQVTINLNGQSEQYNLADLGVRLDLNQTFAALERASTLFPLRLDRSVEPVIKIEEPEAHGRLHQDFGDHLELAQNADLALAGNTTRLIPSKPGQQVDLSSLKRDLQRQLMQDNLNPISLVIISANAAVTDDETVVAKTLTEELLKNGFELRYAEETLTIQPGTIRRLISFNEQTDSTNPQNTVLGVTFDAEDVRQYLVNTLQPDINQDAVNARFVRQDNRVEQFALPQRGQKLFVEESISKINAALTERQTGTELIVEITEPDVAEVADIEQLGVTDLLASGESDFVGSPVNRVHNIRVGASKYHGLLIAPGEEFSFNKFLGPVDASGGFKPELVIKKNVTIPEFGGGLCQVSSTIFRAAAQSGMAITERKNHSYAVRYYGTPGFDATIYPGYTDFRFLNNTPSYILIQTRIEGTKLYFDFWGTKDGRSVEIDGPHPYDRQPSGAVKATLKQTVIKDGQTIINDTFYSNYKSPELFPHATTANGET